MGTINSLLALFAPTPTQQTGGTQNAAAAQPSTPTDFGPAFTLTLSAGTVSSTGSEKFDSLSLSGYDASAAGGGANGSTGGLATAFDQLLASLGGSSSISGAQSASASSSASSPMQTLDSILSQLASDLNTMASANDSSQQAAPQPPHHHHHHAEQTAQVQPQTQSAAAASTAADGASDSAAQTSGASAAAPAIPTA